MRNHGCGKQSEAQYASRGLWAQAGQGIRGSCAQAGAGEREGHHLPQQRGGASHPQSIHQGPARGGGKALKTSNSALLRITDRGPFVNNRIIDLSKAAAMKLDVWRPGTALVKVEVLETPKPIDSGGKWCVQIGGFKDAEDAARLKDRLSRRYQTVKNLQFTSPVGQEWLRVR